MGTSTSTRRRTPRARRSRATRIPLLGRRGVRREELGGLPRGSRSGGRGQHARDRTYSRHDDNEPSARRGPHRPAARSPTGSRTTCSPGCGARSPVVWHPVRPDGPGKGAGFWSADSPRRRGRGEPRRGGHVQREPATMIFDTLDFAGPEPDAPRMLVHMDPPQHTRFRLLVNRGLHPTHDRATRRLHGR